MAAAAADLYTIIDHRHYKSSVRANKIKGTTDMPVSKRVHISHYHRRRNDIKCFLIKNNVGTLYPKPVSNRVAFRTASPYIRGMQ